MNILEAIIGLPFIFLPRQPIPELDIKCLAVICLQRLQVAVMNVRELREKLRMFLAPDQMRSLDPFVEVPSLCRRKLVAIHRTPKLQSVKARWACEYAHHPSPIVIDISAVACFAEHRRTSVAQSRA